VCFALLIQRTFIDVSLIESFEISHTDSYMYINNTHIRIHTHTYRYILTHIHIHTHTSIICTHTYTNTHCHIHVVVKGIPDIPFPQFSPLSDNTDTRAPYSTNTHSHTRTLLRYATTKLYL